MKLPLETLYAYPPARFVGQEIASIKVFNHLTSLGVQRSAQPIAIYIHIPFCLHFCHFCGFVKAEYESRIAADYVDALKYEIAEIASRLPYKLQVDAVYFGGGTPSTFSTAQIAGLLECLRNNFSFSQTFEATFEGECLSLAKPGYLEALISLGFDRLSFGVQVAHPGVRKGLNLRPTISALARLGERACQLFDDVCIDYIFGWPGLEGKQQASDLKTVLNEVRATTVELFRFEPLDASPVFMNALSDVTSDYLNLSHYLKGYHQSAETLSEFGFAQKSNTLFSLKQRELKYYSAYYGWEARGLLGFGVGAQSFLSGLMWGSSSDVRKYIELSSSGQLPYESVNFYDAHTKELVTWPRRGRIRKDFVNLGGSDDYRKKLLRFEQAGIVRQIDDSFVIPKEAWAYAPVLMHTFLEQKDAEIYDGITMNRAALRGLSFAV